MDYSGTVDYDVNTPFKYEGDEPDTVPQSDDGGVDDSNRVPVHHHQDDLIYPPLDFATPTPQAMDNPHSVPSSNTHLLESQHTQSLGDNSHHLSNNIGTSSSNRRHNNVVEDTTTLRMETETIHETDNQPEPSSPESEDLPLARRTAPARRSRGRPARSTRTNKSFAEADDDEEEEFDQKPPKGLFDSTPSTPLLGTQSIFSAVVQKERRTQLTKGAKKKKKTEPEFCRFCFTNELHLQKVRTVKLPPTSSNPNTKFTTLVPSVIESVQLGLTDKWTNPSFALVCDDCVQVFSSFYEFRTNVETNDALLRKLYCKSKAKSKKPPPSAPATPTPTPTPPPSSGKGGKRGKAAKPDPSSAEDSEAVSTVSTKQKKPPGRRGRPPKASVVTDDDDNYETDGYLSSVSKTSRKSTTSRKGGSKKKRGVTSDDDTDGYMSSVSKKSTTVTNTSAAAKNAKKKRRYNSDSDNEDVKSDISDGMDFGGPTPYDYDHDEDDDDPWNNVDQDRKSTKTHRKRSKSKVTESRTKKIQIKTEADDSKSWNVKVYQLLDHDVKVKVEADQEIGENGSSSDEESNDGATRNKTSFKNIISKYVGYDIDDLNTIDKNRARRVSANEDNDNSTKKKRGKNKIKEPNEEMGEEKAKAAKKPKKVNLLTLEELEVKKKEHEIKTLERKRKKLANRENKKKNIDLNKKPSDMDNIFASLDEMESSEEEEEENDEDWDEIHLGLFSPYEYKCRVCDWKLNSHEKLLRHIKSDHGGYETSSLCSYCGYYSKNRSTLKNHVRVEHGENQAKRKEKKICDICSAEVVHLAIHKKHSHSGTYHVCPHCGKKFTRKAELQLHIKGIHMKHQLDKTYVCEYCHKEFTFYNYLRRHMRVHTNEKPYKCKDCGVGFNHNVSLKNHMNSACPKRDPNATPGPDTRVSHASHLSSNSTSPSHHGGLDLGLQQHPIHSMPNLAPNSNPAVRIPKFDRRQHQRSMMEMIQNSSNIASNVTFPAMFDAAHMYYYG